jgi:hypothetical protein
MVMEDTVRKLGDEISRNLLPVILKSLETAVRGALGNGATRVAVNGTAKRGGAPKALKRDMRCRAGNPRCPNRSKGPRFGYLCESHLKRLSKPEQRKAIEQFKAREAKAA